MEEARHAMSESDARRQEAEAWVAQNVTSDPGCDHCERGAMAARCAYLAGRRAGEKAGEERVRDIIRRAEWTPTMCGVEFTMTPELSWAFNGEGEPPKEGA